MKDNWWRCRWRWWFTDSSFINIEIEYVGWCFKFTFKVIDFEWKSKYVRSKIYLDNKSLISDGSIVEASRVRKKNWMMIWENKNIHFLSVSKVVEMTEHSICFINIETKYVGWCFKLMLKVIVCTHRCQNSLKWSKHAIMCDPTKYWRNIMCIKLLKLLFNSNDWMIKVPQWILNVVYESVIALGWAPFWYLH